MFQLLKTIWIIYINNPNLRSKSWFLFAFKYFVTVVLNKANNIICVVLSRKAFAYCSLSQNESDITVSTSNKI